MKFSFTAFAASHAANSMGSARISTARRAVGAWVTPTDEERVIGGHALRVLGA
jgi:hypothetical protein